LYLPITGANYDHHNYCSLIDMSCMPFQLVSELLTLNNREKLRQWKADELDMNVMGQSGVSLALKLQCFLLERINVMYNTH